MCAHQPREGREALGSVKKWVKLMPFPGVRRPGASSTPRAGRASGRPGPEPPRGLGARPGLQRRLPDSGSRSGGLRPGAPPMPVPSNAPKLLRALPGGAPAHVPASLPQFWERETGSPVLFFWAVPQSAGDLSSRARAGTRAPGRRVLAPGHRAVPAEGPPGAWTGLLGAAEAGTRHLHMDTDLARPPAGLGARGRPERLLSGPALPAAAPGGPRACPGRREEGGVVGDGGRCPGPRGLPPPAPPPAS